VTEGRASERIQADFIIIGSGAAGLRAALDLAPCGHVLILTKTEIRESNSRYAQGGIAAAIGKSDSTELHFSDTLAAGAGLCDEKAVQVLVQEGPSEIDRLIGWGTGFDRHDGNIELAREGAHSRARVLHAEGDATGKEIVRALSEKVQTFESAKIIPFAFVHQLIVVDGRVCGVRFSSHGKIFEAIAPATLIASGGAGQVYRETTNPPVATGDGFALGYRAGAVLRDMEFVQFHPTALKLPNLPPFLISEAIRGEGAYLITNAGERFVDELAPRDVVARAVYERLKPDQSVFLDLRHLPPENIRTRFPSIFSFCLQQGFDITRQPVPVVPAAHYFMGGLHTDLQGRTSVAGLFAAGEAASTGIHGANRLASNSLLECVVFGRRAAAAMKESMRHGTPRNTPERPVVPVPRHSESARFVIRDAAWLGAGIIRSEAALKEGLAILESTEAEWEAIPAPSLEQLETSNLLVVARMILECALKRLESRGAHYRSDYPARDDKSFAFHSWVNLRGGISIGPHAHRTKN
jgi:L-aspartate oxidase